METFLAKTDEAFTIKTIAEVLQNILTDVCFVLDNDKIHLRTVDNKQPPSLLVNLELHRDRFEDYKCRKEEPVGLNLQHMYKLLKSIKKKDRVVLLRTTERPDHIGFSKLSAGNQPAISWLKTQKKQILDIDLPTGYSYPNLIPTTDFQKLCKEINSLSKVTKIYSKGSYLCFSCDVDGMYTHDVPFGELDQESTEEEYEDTFTTKSLAQLIKISGLNTKMQIYTRQGLPLKISVDAGTLGRMDIYIKSRSQLEAESRSHH